jgi:phosphatidylcholine synthase
METRGQRIAAWGVHAYTAMGLPLAVLQTVALFGGRTDVFFALNCVAVFVDATDGTLARRIRVKEVLPAFDGRRLDDITDFIVFAFLPSVALFVLGMLPEGLSWVAFLPLLASGYGFCQERAKTEESFVGFPSYWNIGVLYLYVLKAPPWITLAVIVVFSLLVFVPFHYVYPTRTRLLRRLTVGLGSVWAATMFAVALRPSAPWAVELAVASLVYPLYYFALSAVHHVRIVRDARFRDTLSGEAR